MFFRVTFRVAKQVQASGSSGEGSPRNPGGMQSRYDANKERRRNGGAQLWLRNGARSLLFLAALAAWHVLIPEFRSQSARSAIPLSSATLCGPAPFFCRKRNAAVTAPENGGSVAAGRPTRLRAAVDDDPCAMANWASLDVLVVVAHFAYNTSWLVQQPFCYVLMEKNKPAAAPFNTALNKAQEAWCYMQFVVDVSCDAPPRLPFAAPAPPSSAARCNTLIASFSSFLLPLSYM